MPQHTVGNPQPRGPVEPGDYICTVVTAEMRKSKADNDVVNVKLHIADEAGTVSGTCFDTMAFTPKSAWKVDAFLISTGAAKVNESIEFDEKFCQTLIGRRGWASIGKDDPNAEGKVYNKVTAWLTNKGTAEPDTEIDAENIPF